jgi:hypothetical protein
VDAVAAGADPRVTDLRCSSQSRSLGELPGGSASSADRFLLVELPQPWPSRIEDHPLLTELPPAPASLGVTRVLAIRGSDEGAPRTARVIVYLRTPGTPFGGYAGFEIEVGVTALGQALAAIHGGDHRSMVPLNRAGIDGQPVRDVLLCTHGSRDRCCGQMGSLLFLESIGQLPGDIRLWRSSHTGGHRFAPTGVTFPDGLTWAHLDARLLCGLLDRSVSPEELHVHLRGCAGFDGPDQVADAAAFAVAGWSWIDQPRAIVRRVVSLDGTGPEHRISIAGSLRQFTIRVGEVEPIPVPPCGLPVDGTSKASSQYVVVAVDEH